MIEPQSSGPQLLEIRLQALESDVDKVQSVINKVFKGTEPLNEIFGHLHPQNDDGLHVLLDKLDDIVFRLAHIMRYPEIRSAIERRAEGLPSILDGQLPAHVTQMVKVREAIKGCADRINSEANFLAEPQQQLLAESINDGCSSLRAQITTIKTKLAACGEDRQKYRNLWTEFDGKLSDDAQRLFADFVDFVGGLTVRGNALDDQVCYITDLLLKELTPTVTADVALPARQTALSQVMQSVIKMGFPEWAIWGIPLVGHEVGLKLARAELKKEEQSTSIKELLTEHDSYDLTSRQMMNLFADIFATYKLGPSYANAVIQLRLEAHRSQKDPSDDDPPDADRAYLILKLLRLLHEHTGLRLDAAYSKSITRIEKVWSTEAWSLAVAETGHARALDRLLDDAWQALFTPKRFLAFDYEPWDNAQDLQHYLLTGEDKPKAQPKIIALLAAAWEARNAEPWKTAEIERRAKVLVVGPRETTAAWPFSFAGQPGGAFAKENLTP